MRQRLAEAVRAPRPRAQANGIMNLGGGVAIRIVSPALSAIRDSLADAFSGLLTPQDAAGWRPHVTIQNKVSPLQAKALHGALADGFQARDIVIEGLAAWRYRGGPWEPVARHKFRG